MYDNEYHYRIALVAPLVRKNHMHLPKTVRVLLGGAVAVSLFGCASPASGDGGGAATAADDGLIQVVASTNVYGDIASRIGGDLVEVSSIITSAAQDPHSYEASAQDQLALSEADLVIENGGGYDPFIDTLLDGSDNADVLVLDASNASGLLAEGDESVEGFNEHVWYSFDAVDEIAHEIARDLGELDESDADVFEANYDAFAAELAVLHDRGRGMNTLTEGKSVAITEPVPVYLLEDVGLTNATPGEFSEAIEEGTDVAPAVLQETLDIFASGTVALLAYNEQTAGPETEQVRAAAEDADVPVVSLTETLPEGETYLDWMTANLDAIEAALS